MPREASLAARPLFPGWDAVTLAQRPSGFGTGVAHGGASGGGGRLAALAMAPAPPCPARGSPVASRPHWPWPCARPQVKPLLRCLAHQCGIPTGDRQAGRKPPEDTAARLPHSPGAACAASAPTRTGEERGAIGTEGRHRQAAGRLSAPHGVTLSTVPLRANPGTMQLSTQETRGLPRDSRPRKGSRMNASGRLRG